MAEVVEMLVTAADVEVKAMRRAATGLKTARVAVKAVIRATVGVPVGRRARAI